MIVLDASAGLELLGDTHAGHAVSERLLLEPDIHAPHLLDIEIMSALRRQFRLGAIREDRVRQSLSIFLQIRIFRHPHGPLLERIWALRENFSAYDACYLALAEALNGTLLTCDGALGSAKLRRGSVEVI